MRRISSRISWMKDWSSLSSSMQLSISEVIKSYGRGVKNWPSHNFKSKKIGLVGVDVDGNILVYV
jgi:hypothetical protein